jgi:hypothetical protein
VFPNTFPKLKYLPFVEVKFIILLLPKDNVGFEFTNDKFGNSPISAYTLPTAAPIILVGP